MTDATAGAATEAYDNGVPRTVAEAAGVSVAVAVAVAVGVALAAVALTGEAAGAVRVAAPEHVLAALEASDADKAGLMGNARCSGCGCCDMLESEVARRAHGDDDHGDGAAPPTTDAAVEATADDSDGGNDAGDSDTGAEADTDGGEAIGAAGADAARGVTVAAALMTAGLTTAAGAGETSVEETGRDRGGAAGDAEGSGGVCAASARTAARETPHCARARSNAAHTADADAASRLAR